MRAVTATLAKLITRDGLLVLKDHTLGEEHTVDLDSQRSFQFLTERGVAYHKTMVRVVENHRLVNRWLPLELLQIEENGWALVPHGDRFRWIAKP